ncbi:hypothetical protein K504DRAFT_466725 [Pleomassaria siparia CBS 279.74]|uniref:Eisosome protein 1 n=1 Tax=Pleomassaria siparia CBS 279.74 TaxID=1314801 RepID=A0A6G1KCP1_9PLEO|nr:hypothetical protein K504DRAFT_466725 [Pleomassaria siparia CBS 279.74]
MATQTHSTANDADNGSLKGALHSNAPGAQTTNMRCPDPSAHETKNSTLQDQASAAALYNTRGSNAQSPLGSDGKLSPASAATSLKQARAQDLPGYPIVGIDARSSAGTAANLAHANQKSPEWWKPEQSAAAGKAALLAHSYKSAPVWQPEASSAGSKAALLAHKDGVKLNPWTPEASAVGNSAANIAMRKKTPELDGRHTQNKPNGALLAATGAISNSGRKRAQSTPAAPIYPDSNNSARNALSAATIAHGPSARATKPQTTVTDSNRLGSGAMEAARIQHSKSISRDMYTSNPPVALEVEEKRHDDALRASAISMAKKMYNVQQSNTEQAASRAYKSQAQSGATSAHGVQPAAGSEADIKQQAMRYIGIQEAAQKLAAERLAKIGPDENAAFRSYYGYEKPRSKLNIRRGGRTRASSNPEPADSSDEDEFRSRRIRSQMSQFNKAVAEVDAKKQDQDRKNLLAAAQRKVNAQMLGMDKKIFDDTGKMSPAMIEEWDARARAKAAANSEVRMENHGKIHIGGGKYVDHADVNAVAQARIQPTLDEITEKTEKRRAEEEEQRLEMEEKKRQALNEKERAAQLKAEEKRIKDEEKRAAKSRTNEEKVAAKQEKEAEKEKKAEEKRLQKEERGKSRDGGAPTPANMPIDAHDTTKEQNDSLYRDSAPRPTATSHVPETESSDAASSVLPTSPSSPKSDSKGIKSFLNKFKRRSKHSAASAENEKPGFIGGNTLRKASVAASPAPEPIRSSQHRHSGISSISSGEGVMSSDERGRTPERTFSEQSAVSGNTDFDEAEDDFDEKLAPPLSFGTADADAVRKGSPNRDSRFHEIGI